MESRKAGCCCAHGYGKRVQGRGVGGVGGDGEGVCGESGVRRRQGESLLGRWVQLSDRIREGSLADIALVG